MKHVWTFLTVVLAWSLLTSSGTDDSTAEELGNRIFQAICENDLAAINSMVVTKEDLLNTIDHAEMEADRKKKLKVSLVEKIDTDMPATLAGIEEGFQAIRTVVDAKKCRKETAVDRIIQNTGPIKGLPFELGDLTVTFNCSKHIGTLKVEIIKTETGWHILEKLRLVRAD